MEDNQVQAPDQAALGGEQQDGNTTQFDAKAVTGGKLDTPKTFTQEDVSGIAAKESKKAQEKILRDLGIEDFETAKEGLEKFRAWQDEQKTDQQRKDEELTTYQTQAQQAQEELKNLKSQVAAMELNVNADDLEDVLALAEKRGKDDIKEAIAEVIERYPHFTKQPAQEETPAPKYTSGQHKKDSPESDPFIAALFGKK